VAALLLVLITAAVYLPVMNQQFSGWDDERFMAVVWKPSWERARAIATDWKLTYSGEAYYAPLHLLSLMADQVLVTGSSPNPAIPKLVNVAFHGANSILVLLFCLATGVGARPAFLAALIFAVHPIQVGTVAWISERKNVLFTFFYLSAMLVYMRYLVTGRVRYAISVIVLFLLGLLAKPAAITLPLALVSLPVTFRPCRVGTRGIAFLLGPLVALAAVWGLYVLSTEVTHTGVLPGWPYRPFIAAAAFWFYVEKILVPWDLVPVYPRWNVSASIPLFSVLLGAFVAVSALVVRLRRCIDSWILWGGFFFLLNLILVSGLIPFGYMSQSFVSDHFLYLPLVGVAVIVARGAEAVFRRFPLDCLAGKAVAVGLYVWIGFLAVLAVKQTLLWRDPLSVWEATLRVNKDSPAVYNNYGLLILARGQAEKALHMFEKVAELAPGVYRGYLNMGHAYAAMGKYEEAKAMYAKAIKIDPGVTEARLLTARILWRQGKQNEALSFLQQSVRDVPGSAAIQSELGLTYYRLGREDDALDAFSKAIALDRFLPDPYLFKGTILLSRGEAITAIPFLEEAVRLAPDAEAYNVLGAAYASRGDQAQALRKFLEAYALQPTHPGVKENVANALLALRNYDGAARFCREAQKIGQPCSPDVLQRIINKSE
jgi:tetratricopeptide (TPR) repeat protein